MCGGGLLITGRSLVWFLVTLVACMTLFGAIVLPKWLIGPEEIRIPSLEGNYTIIRHPSVGIYNRCKRMGRSEYNCGNFDLYGLATDTTIFPFAWKITMFLMCLGNLLLACTLVCMLVTCCRMHSICGFSTHKLLGIFQGIAAMMELCGYMAYPFGWEESRVKILCGLDSEPFAPSDCKLGISIYLGAIGTVLAFISAMLSAKAESAFFSAKAQRSIEEGQVLVCVP
ncbi:AGAP009941-PA-like protein [Anopheles sinensis]|uniref:AGAP009941-PA-like protein n=1 Tax=Anopheles sinensis TaxID=74873 RepID=A0A084VWF4_ANOSI|nr:AGAP009941-PA-like protein [Anopheles sinensis]